MFDLSPMRPWEYAEKVDLVWWAELVEARTIWNDAHRASRKAAESERAGQGP